MKETKDSSQRLNKAEKSWILYDVANSAFIMIVTATIPIYFRSLAEGCGAACRSNCLKYRHFILHSAGALRRRNREQNFQFCSAILATL